MTDAERWHTIKQGGSINFRECDLNKFENEYIPTLPEEDQALYYRYACSVEVPNEYGVHRFLAVRIKSQKEIRKEMKR